MRSKQLILGCALFVLAVGYIELRLPPPVAAQGRDAVYQRLAVSSDARVSGTATVGVLKFETALTPAVTALLAASGTASVSTYLRGDGNWQNPLEAFRGQIAAFNGPCPADWDEMAALRGRMIVGLVDGGTLAQSVGTALTNGASRLGGTAHSHQVRFTQSSNNTGRNPILKVSGLANSLRHVLYSSVHTDETQRAEVAEGTAAIGASDNFEAPAPYVQLRYCEYQP